MADNVTLNSGTGGAVIATDDDGVAHHQYVKLEFGADNTQTKVTTSAGLPTDPLDRAARDCGKIDIAMGQGAHDAAGAALDPVAIGGYASAAAPTDVTADGDLCRIWTTLKGAVNVADAGGSLTVDNAALSVTGGGVEASALRVTIASDSTGVLSVDDNGGSLTVDGTVAATQSGTWTVQPGNTANTTAWLVSPTPATSGGLSIFRSLDLDETEEDIKTAAGQIYGVWVTNTATATRWIKFYNATAANVIVGTTTPVITVGIPGNTSDDIAGLFSSTHGIAFDTAISAAATTGVADADIGAPGVNDVIINVFYK